MVRPLNDDEVQAALAYYSDSGLLSDWGKEAAAYLIAEGIVTGGGNGNLNPVNL